MPATIRREEPLLIVDLLTNAPFYRPLGPRIAAAFDYLGKTDFTSLPAGRYDLDGDRVFAIVQRYFTRPAKEATWEAHRRYLDVQYVAAGTERIGYIPLGPALSVRVPYDDQKDVIFFDARGDSFDVRAGMFAIFAPQDIHAPGLAAAPSGAPEEVLKVVVKCRW